MSTGFGGELRGAVVEVRGEHPVQTGRRELAQMQQRGAQGVGVGGQGEAVEGRGPQEAALQEGTEQIFTEISPLTVVKVM